MAGFGTLSPGEEAAAEIETPNVLANFIAHTFGSLASLPRRAIENSQVAVGGGPYNPAPVLEAALLPMGTGALAGVPVKAGEAVLGAGPIRAYHGSPHSFDKFDLSKIGTGEGYQNFGHGLYFAEKQEVASGYKDALKGRGSHMFNLDGKPIPANDLANLMQAEAGKSPYYGVRAVLNDLASGRSLSDLRKTSPASTAKTIDWLESRGVTHSPPPGHMYEVEIGGNPEHFLDWDKPLSAQHPKVQEAFKDIPADTPGQMAYYRKAGGKMESPETSAALKSAGVPGIKYLDYGSRGAGEGTRNFVVFDDKMVDILRKYGLAGIPGGAAAFGALARPPEEHL